MAGQKLLCNKDYIGAALVNITAKEIDRHGARGMRGNGNCASSPHWKHYSHLCENMVGRQGNMAAKPIKEVQGKCRNSGALVHFLMKAPGIK